jgi:hypothetical protein
MAQGKLQAMATSSTTREQRRAELRAQLRESREHYERSRENVLRQVEILRRIAAERARRRWF